jgi:hypothetical protein
VASYGAIAAAGQALLGLLADACPKPEFATARFELYQAQDLKEPMDDGVALYLYRVAINGSQRNLPARVLADGRRFKPGLPLDLHYLLIPWAREAVKQQRLLGWCMRAIEDMPILPAGLLNHFAPEPDTFHPSETVELITDPLSMQDLTNIWDAFKPTTQLAAGYIARMVVIDSPLEVVGGVPVQTRVFDAGVLTTP